MCLGNSIFLYLISGYCWRVSKHAEAFWLNAPVWRRVWWSQVIKNVLLASHHVLCRVFYHIAVRVSYPDGQIRDGSWFELCFLLFSLLHSKLCINPPCLCLLHIHPLSLNCVFWSLLMWYKFWFISIVSFN